MGLEIAAFNFTIKCLFRQLKEFGCFFDCEKCFFASHIILRHGALDSFVSRVTSYAAWRASRHTNSIRLG